MNPENNSQAMQQTPEEPETSNTLTIDEFFRQLEAKEKDLDISSELVIEIEDSDADGQDISDFLQMDLSVAPSKPEPAQAATLEENPLHKTDLSNLHAEIENLQNQIAKMESERVEMFELSRRRQNDFENYKTRTERERGDTFRNQLSNLATQMLPVIDNLNRALDSTETVKSDEPQDFKQFYDGIVLVSQQMNEILAEMGVQPIHAVGEPFDPHFHEAVATEPNDEVPSQTVTMELLRGYRIGEKVIRPSMVKVSVSSPSTGSLPEATSLITANSPEEK